MAAILAPIGLALTAASTVVGFIGANQQAEAAKAEGEFKAKQLEQKANEERAVGQRELVKERKQKEIIQSKLMTRAAAATGDTTDTGVLTLAGDIEEEGEMRALTEFYKGENAARGYQDAAGASRATASSRAAGYRLKGIGTLLEGGASFADKYNKKYG